MDKFNHPLILSYVGEHELQRSRERVFNEIVAALSDQEGIMALHWTTLEKAWFGEATGVCCRVWSDGWDYDENTRKLRRMFENVVQPFVDKNLEDYL